MLLIPDCSDRTARKIDKHVLSVPLTLMMGRRYFFMQSWLNWYSIGLENRHPERVLGSGGACSAPTEAERRTQGSNPWLCVMHM